MSKLARLAATIQELRAAHPEWREGQTAFNALHRLHPHVADTMRGTHDDPFYSDERLERFWDRVAFAVGD